MAAGQSATAICLPGALVVCDCMGKQGISACEPSGASYGACQCPSGSTATPTKTGGTGGMQPVAMTVGPSAGAGATTAPPARDAGSQPTDNGQVQTTPPEPTHAPLVSGLKIAELAIYQPVKVSLVKNGEAVVARNAPVVVGKQALVRVSVETLPGWSARDVVAELTLSSSEGPAKSQSVTKRVTATSSDPLLDSTINFDIPGEQVAADLRYSIALREAAGATAAGTSDPTTRFPATEDELAPLGPREAGPVHVMFVPYRYTADGSNRLPATDQKQMDLYRQYLQTYYPTSEISIELHDPVDYTQAVGPNTGWEEWLDFHCMLRTNENPDPKLMYYGALAPRASLQAYGSGIIGISYVPTAAGNYGRCSVGVGWEGSIATSTAAHELGHALGLEHAPCGVDGGPYPYADALTGVWGYAFGQKVLVDPSKAHDLMSYCDPVFISDYNFQRLFQRIRYLNLQFDETPAPSASYVRVLASHGGLSLRGRVDMRRDPGGPDQQRTVTLLDEVGQTLQQTSAYYFPMSENGSGTWLIPDLGASAARIEGVGTVELK